MKKYLPLLAFLIVAYGGGYLLLGTYVGVIAAIVAVPYLITYLLIKTTFKL